MAKQLAFNEEARAAIARGVTKLARAVKITLGPRGRNAVLDKGYGSPTVTKDGVSVAEEIGSTISPAGHPFSLPVTRLVNMPGQRCRCLVFCSPHQVKSRGKLCFSWALGQYNCGAR